MIVYSDGNLNIDNGIGFDGTTNYMRQYKIDGHIRIASNIDYPLLGNPAPNIDMTGAPEGFRDPGRRAGYIDGYTVKLNVPYQYGEYPIGFRYGIYYQDLSYGTPTYYVTYDVVSDANYGITVLACNLPIFRTLSEALQYILVGDNYAAAVNYVGGTPEDDEPVEHYIYNKYGDATSSYDGLDFGDSEIYERFEKFTITKNTRAVLVKIPDTLYGYNIQISGEVLGSKYATNSNWSPYITRDNELSYYGPFYTKWDQVTYSDEPFTVAYENYFETSLLKFENSTDAQDYMDGNDDAAKKASNYDDIVNRGYTSYVNNTGDPENGTEFGESYHRGAFVQKYVLSRAMLQQIANNMYDSTSGGLIEDIKKGLELYGANPIESVIDCEFVPFNAAEMFATSPQSYVYFGGYKMDLSGNVNKIIWENGYKDMGTFKLLPTFGSYRDYEPYQRCFIYLPYCGTYPLDLKRYMNKTISIRYYFDATTGGCLACVMADGVLVDSYNGNMAVKIPLMGTNFGAYANAQMGVLMGGANSIGNTIGNVGNGVANAMAGNVGGAVSGIGGGVLGGTVGTLATEFNLSQNNINNFNKTVGTSSGHINEFLPQYVYFIFEIMDCKETENLLTLVGKPSNVSGRLKDFSGFLSVDSVELNCPRATESEKNEILSLLSAGIRI